MSADTGRPTDGVPLVRVEQLNKTFMHQRRMIQVLRTVDFTIAAGEMVAVVGPSGVGKSTLLQILGTLDAPTSGRVLFDDIDVFALSDDRQARFRNERIGFVFQFHYLLPEFSALENVMMPALIGRLRRNEAQDRARSLLEQVGLAHRLTHKPSELSGGEQQRVALARALVMRPGLVLADEPTGNLDETTSREIHELFFALNARTGTTFLVVTHNVGLAKRMPRTIRLVAGAVQEGLPDDQAPGETA